MSLAAILLSISLAAEAGPVTTWHGASDPSGACEVPAGGERIVQTPEGKVFACVNGTWSDRTASAGTAFTASGATLARTAADRAGEVVNAADFAPGLTRSTNTSTAATHNTTALRAAVARCTTLASTNVTQAGSVEVVVPAGTYYVNGGIEFPMAGCSGLRGLGGTVTLVWNGANTGYMIRFGGYYQRLEDVSLVGGASRPLNGKGLVGVYMYDAYHAHVKDRFRNVTFQQLSVGVKAARPNPARGGQNEGTSFSDCLFVGNYIGVLVDQGNVDYWTFISTYWMGNVMGVYVSPSGAASQWTLVGCVATDNLTDPYSSWITIDPQAFTAFGNFSFINCQTEQVQWMWDGGGRYNIALDGSQVLGMRLNNLSGEITFRSALIPEPPWVAPASLIADGVKKVFAFTFACDDPSKIQVQVTAGAPGTPYYPTWDFMNNTPLNYAVTSCTPSGGTITFATPPGRAGAPSSDQQIVTILKQGSYSNGILVTAGYVQVRDLGNTTYLTKEGAVSTIDHVMGDLHGAYFWLGKPWAVLAYYEDRSKDSFVTTSTWPLKIRVPSSLGWKHLPAVELGPVDGDAALKVSSTPAADRETPTEVHHTATTWTSGAELRGYVQIDVGGGKYWIPYYSHPTGP